MIIDADAEHSVDVGACAHGEEMMQPDRERQHADGHGRRHHRAVAKYWLAGEGRDHFREDAEGRQNKDVDLRMAPDPDEVIEHHHIAAGLVGEEMEAEVAIEQQHRESRRQHREGRDDEQHRGQRRPAENRHAHIGHAGRVQLEDRRDEIDACQQRADAGDLQRPQIVVDAHSGE